ncbi:MAG: SoxR reducing system RseC family protein [Bacillota bacterium]
MEKIGRVVEVKEKSIRIEIIRASACGEKCGECSGGCSKTGIYVEAQSKVDVVPGQFVVLHTKTKEVMKAAFYVYIIPLIMLITGVFAGSFFYPLAGIQFVSSELFSIITGILAMVVSFIFVKWIDAKFRNENKIEYTIIRGF